MFDDDDESSETKAVAPKPTDELEPRGAGSDDDPPPTGASHDFSSLGATPITITVPVHRLRTWDGELIVRVHEVSLTATIRVDVRRKE